jgi:hypothetical protein
MKVLNTAWELESYKKAAEKEKELYDIIHLFFCCLLINLKSFCFESLPVSPSAGPPHIHEIPSSPRRPAESKEQVM